MRIVHTADVHIGVENYGRPATQADVDALPPYFAPGVDRRTYLGLSTRLLDFLSALDQVVDYAVRHDADLVLIAGDAYKSRDPSQTHQREFVRRVATLVNRGIPVFLLTGNHDIAHSPTRATALAIFPTLDVSGVTVAERFGTHRVETRSGPLQIVALPWIRRGQLLAREEHQGAPIDEVTRYVEADLTARILQEADALDPALPAILAAHVTVNGSVSSSERSMMLGRDYALQPSSLALPAFDYVALGHVHKHQSLIAAPPVVYPGSLQRVDFSEEDDSKGFCVVDIDPAAPPGRRTQWQHVPVDARPFLTVEVTVPTDEQDPTALVLRRIEQRDVTGAIVRVHVTVPSPLAGRVNERAIRDALASAHSVAAVSRQVVHERRPRIGSDASGITPQQALERYLGGRADLDDTTRKRALEWGTELVAEETARE
ncbi:MAG: exonuclease SbcCD subunit D [Chloroflexota bacterium]|nr:exonuclease SbcCD subunit D [Chloroflexota bacterium]MDE2968643.1 exonuclease SbcCD subunit D [Chloroflexota bacterium]